MRGVWGPWLWAAISAFSLFAIAGRLSAEDRLAGGIANPPTGENLLADDRPLSALLAADKPTGWSLADGKLRGETSAKPLPVTLVPGDFELHAAWTVTGGAGMVLEFATTATNAPSGNGADANWQLRLAETPGVTIKLPSGARIMKVAPNTHAKRHSTVVRCAEGKLTITTDGIASRELPLASTGPWNLSLSIAAGEGTLDWLRLVDGLAAKP